MENLLFPVCVEEYCNYFGVTFSELNFLCIFCRCPVPPLELLTFQYRQLSLVWREGTCYAACIACIERVAKYERDKFFQCAVNGMYIEFFTKTPLQDLIVRCMFCMRLLTSEEKIDIIGAGATFCLVRGHWKGYCRDCFQNAGSTSDN